MKLLDQIRTQTAGALAVMAVFAAATVVSPFLPHTTLRAQETGRRGAPGAGSAAVSSVFGRTGAITAAAGDYTAAQVTDAAATNAANTFTASQTISTANPALEMSDPAAALYDLQLFNDATSNWAGFYSPGQSVGLLYLLNQSASSGGNQLLQVGGASRLCWSSAPQNSTVIGDTGLSRIGSSTAALGNCGSGDTSGWLQLAAIGNGAAGNTDLRGHLTLAAGAGTYSFLKAYTVAPTCTAADTTSVAAVRVQTTTTTLTLTGTGTDVVSYVCAD
ncbi:MAG TPA: hypothetical protein VGR96_15720 [Acidobacteriaceae bacterium]|nr:hypothetical protein [Acidobacteriaceae bacterium]